jgi:hypothetical protein
METSMITTEQLADRWDLTPQMIRWLIKFGRIPGVVRKGRGYLIPSDVEPVERYKSGRKKKDG